MGKKALIFKAFYVIIIIVKLFFIKEVKNLEVFLSNNMDDNVKTNQTNQTNVKEYIKSKLKAFIETFATLGDIIGGTSDPSKLTEAEQAAEEIEKQSDLARIKKLEDLARGIPDEKEDKKAKTRKSKSEKVESKVKSDKEKEKQEKVKGKTRNKPGTENIKSSDEREI